MKSFPQLSLVKPLDNFIIYLEYSDHTKGEIDLSHLTHKGVFKKWDDKSYFSRVFINEENGSIAWDDIIEICPDSQYLKLIGKSFEEWTNSASVYA